MKRTAIRLSAAALAAVFVVGWVAEATAQHSNFYPSYSINSAKRQAYPANRQNYSPPNRNTYRPDAIHRPDLPLEQQLHYDRNAVGHTVG